MSAGSRRIVLAAATGALALLAPQVAATSAPHGRAPVKPDPGPTVTTEAVTVRRGAVDRTPRLTQPARVTWPAAGSTGAVVTQGDAGGMRVETLPRAASAEHGVSGPVLRVTGGGKAGLKVDYSPYRHAYGGDWDARLRLVELGDHGPVPVQSRNDVKSGEVTADVAVPASGALYALDAAPSGSTGDYRASFLSPSGSWDVSTQTGDFTWSEPVGAPPPVPGGFEPSFELSYASGSVDGRVASTNNQASWVGEGWDLGVGFIERRYKGCADDLAPGQPKTGDLCWETDNATMSLGGRSTDLVKVAGTNTWRPLVDDGSRVELLTGAANGARNGEHWRVTTTDGTQHYFGLHRLPGWSTGKPETGSTWTVPVFGDDDGEPCHQSTFAASSCQQAWRWNLDYSVDPRGNTIAYYYARETNAYGLNLGAAKASYTRGGVLLRAEYGSRRGEEYTTGPSARIVFETADRCVTGTTCAHTAAAQPDVPWDLNCDTATCPGRYSPTFWSTKRLARVVSQVRDGTNWPSVDEWVLTHSFPAPGDGTTPALWLDHVTHTGLANQGSEPMPPVTFFPAPYANRVDTSTDGPPAMIKFRIGTVRNSAGGDVNVIYDRDCGPGAHPAPHLNTTRCFPIRWTPEGGTARDDWFSKYAVARIVEDDRVGGARPEVTNYEYLDGAGWRYNDDELVPPERRTWSRFRGYEKVRVLHGDPAEPRIVRSSTVYQYHRGMHGDRLSPTGGTRTVRVVDSEGIAHDDLDELSGFLRETITYEGVRSDNTNGPEVDGTINEPVDRETASFGSLHAHFVAVARTRTRAALAGGGRRTTRTDYTYNAEGLQTQVDDFGDEVTAADDRCTRTTYARDTAAWRLDLPSRVVTVDVACSQHAASPTNVVEDTRTFYDDRALGEPPTTGALVRTEVLDDSKEPAPEYVTTATTRYDPYGRVVESQDALGRKTTHSFSPATGRPTSTTTVDPKDLRTTTTLDAARGQATAILDVDNNRTTELGYDAAGRLTGVWKPGRKKGVFGPHVRFRYRLRTDGTSWVATDTLAPNNNYVTSYALYDGFLRERQSQAPGSGGGRVFTATRYDSRGLVAATTGPEHTTGTPSGDLIRVDDSLAYAQTVTSYDGAERPVATSLRSLGVEQWHSAMRHDGESTSVTPPSGGIATTTYTDARGRVVKRLQYHGATPTGSHDLTQYTYAKGGQLASVEDAAGNRWRYEYDLRGRRTSSVDPDAGTTDFRYDHAGQLTSVTTARGRTLAYAYDELGRKTAVHAGSLTGPRLAAWTYDTLPGGKGLLTRSVRYAGDAEYAAEVTGYEAATGRPQGSSVVIPDTEEGLAGTYTTRVTYRADGSPSTTVLPALGSLPPETLVHDYDTLGQPFGLKSELGDYVTETIYDWYGKPSRRTLGAVGAEVWDTRFYDAATQRLSRALIERRLGTISVDDTVYTYDAAGNVTRIWNRFTGATAEAQCFRYNHVRQLTEAWATTAADCAGAPGSGRGGPAPYWTSLRYDAAGNRTSEVRHAPTGDLTRTYTYPAAGQPQPHAVQSVVSTGPAGSRTDSFEYDAAGDTTSARGTALGWDDEGHLAAMGSSSFVYDADGQRLIRRDASGKTLFLPSGEVRSTGDGTRYYANGGETVAVRTSDRVDYLLGDHHGTDTVAIDSASLAAVRRRSDPFGNPRGPQPQWPGSHGFVGGIDDPTGLTHLGAREYDPDLGRFISVDPIIDVNDPQQINGYAYANGNPTTMSDPDGLLATSCPDGECRFGGYGTGQSPASRFNNYRTLRNGRGVRCPDGARTCRAVRGTYAPPRLKPKPAPRPKVELPGWLKRARNGMHGFNQVNLGNRYAMPYIERRMEDLLDVDLVDVDTNSAEYQNGKEIGQALGDAAMTVAPGGGLGKAAKAGPFAVHWGRQAKHFPGHPNYIPGRSQLTADPRKLAEKAGTGDPVGSTPRGVAGFRERIDYGPEPIGMYVDPTTGVATPTTRAIVHYSNSGIHFTPAMPKI